MYSFSRIIKAKDAKLSDPSSPTVSTQANSGQISPGQKQADLKNGTPVRFIRGIGHIPAKDKNIDSKESKRDILAQTEEIKKQTEERIKIAEKETYDRGFSEGLGEGRNREKMELALPAESIAKLIRELKKLKLDLMKDSEKEIMDLVFLIAGKVIHKEVSTGGEVILSVLREAMKNMQDNQGVRIRLNPGDYRHIIEVKPDFLAGYGDILFEKDEKISRGGAMIETNSGAVDARLDKQLSKIMESLCDEHGF